MEDREQRIKEIVKQVEKLPIEAQRAIGWLIDNIDLVEAMSFGEKMSEAEVAKFTEDARKSKDYIMLAMVLYKQNKDLTETEKQEN
ncbi:MAG: hypothetical protein ACYDG2_03860 [Ruminiclostridium sp.]